MQRIALSLIMFSTVARLCALMPEGSDLLAEARTHMAEVNSYIIVEKIGTLTSGDPVYARHFFLRLISGTVLSRTDTYTRRSGKDGPAFTQITNNDGSWDVEPDALIRIPDSMITAKLSDLKLTAALQRESRPSKTSVAIVTSKSGRQLYVIKEKFSPENIASFEQSLVERRGEAKAAGKTSALDRIPDEQLCPVRVEFLLDPKLSFIVAIKAFSATDAVVVNVAYESVIIRPLTEGLFLLPGGRRPLFPKNESEYNALRHSYFGRASDNDSKQ